MKTIISVIVPAYNVETYIERCLESILDQIQPGIEIIIVDDGSTDNTGRIIDTYENMHPAQIRSIHTLNRGVTAARITGIKCANGEWIGFVDSDDMIESDMYKRLLDNAIKYRADISHCGYKTVVNDGERQHWFYNTGRIVQQDELKGLNDLLSGTYVEPGLCNKLYKKELFADLIDKELVDYNIRFNEDLLMNYYLFKNAKKSIYEDFCPYIYIARPSSATRSNSNIEMLLDSVRVRKTILDDICPELNELAWRNMLICCGGAYIQLFEKNYSRKTAFNIRRFLLKNRGKWRLLSKKQRLKLEASMYMPKLYCVLLNIYIKRFQKKIYE